MLRREKTVPKMSFASSEALVRLALGSCGSQERVYMHSAATVFSKGIEDVRIEGRGHTVAVEDVEGVDRHGGRRVVGQGGAAGWEVVRRIIS